MGNFHRKLLWTGHATPHDSSDFVFPPVPPHCSPKSFLITFNHQPNRQCRLRANTVCYSVCLCFVPTQLLLISLRPQYRKGLSIIQGAFHLFLYGWQQNQPVVKIHLSINRFKFLTKAFSLLRSNFHLMTDHISK